MPQQFPSLGGRPDVISLAGGVLVPQPARAGLLARVHDAGTWLLEDDPYLQPQLDGPACPSMRRYEAA